MRSRAVLLDIGGILEVTPATGWESAWESRLGLRPGELNERLAGVWRDGAIGRITEPEAEAAIGQLLGLEDARLRQLLEDAWAEYLGSLNTELAAWFASLRPRFRTGIISNSFVGAREREERLYGFERMCDLLVYSHEVGVAKPDRRIFELTCERLGVRPRDSVFLDDVEENVLAARSLGMEAIQFESTAQAIREIEARLGG